MAQLFLLAAVFQTFIVFSTLFWLFINPHQGHQRRRVEYSTAILLAFAIVYFLVTR